MVFTVQKLFIERSEEIGNVPCCKKGNSMVSCLSVAVCYRQDCCDLYFCRVDHVLPIFINFSIQKNPTLWHLQSHVHHFSLVDSIISWSSCHFVNICQCSVGVGPKCNVYSLTRFLDLYHKVQQKMIDSKLIWPGLKIIFEVLTN